MFLVPFLLSFPWSCEVLSYDLYLGPFRAGELRLSSKKGFFQGESVYNLSATLKSNFPFKIRDSLFSIARREDFTTIRSYKKVREGRYEAEVAYEFAKGRIVYSDGSVFFCAAPPKDLLSLWYYFRSLNSGEEAFAHFDKKDYQVKISAKESLVLNTALGSFVARRLEPKTVPKSILGDVYISEDSLRLPLIIKTRLLFGLVKGVLKDREAE